MSHERASLRRETVHYRTSRGRVPKKVDSRGGKLSASYNPLCNPAIYLFGLSHHLFLRSTQFLTHHLSPLRLLDHGNRDTETHPLSWILPLRPDTLHRLHNPPTFYDRRQPHLHLQMQLHHLPQSRPVPRTDCECPRRFPGSIAV